MAISFADSLKNSTENNIKHTIESVNYVETNENSIMPLSENYDVAPMADSGNWITDYKYVTYEDFEDNDISTVTAEKDIRLSSRQFNITQEENSQYIPFEMSRYYDGFDLKDAIISIHYETNSGRHAGVKPVNVKYNSEKIRFAWLVDAGATTDAGKLKFEIHAYGSVLGSDGVLKGYVWKSKKNESLNVLESLCDCEDVINNIDDTWLQELVTDIAREVAEEIKNYSVGEEVRKAEQAAAAAEQSADEARIYADNASQVASTTVNAALSNYITKGEAANHVTVVQLTEGYYTKTDTEQRLSSALENYATKDDVSDAISSADLDSYYKKDETYSAAEIDEKLSNVSVDLSDYATKSYVNDKTSILSDGIETNTNSISSLSTTVRNLQEIVNSVDTSPGLSYEATYGSVEMEDGTVSDYMFTLWETEGENEPTVKSRFQIAGGSGTGASNNWGITYVTTSPYVVTIDDNAIIRYKFWGTDSSGDIIPEGKATWKVDGKTVATNTAYYNDEDDETDYNEFDITKYISVGTNKVTLTISDEIGNQTQPKRWNVQKVDMRIESVFNDKTTYPIGKVNFTYTPYGGNISKDIHFILDGIEIDTIPTTSTGTPMSYELPSQTHGSHLLEVYMTATINGNTVPSNRIIKDIAWYDPSSNVPVITSTYQNFTARQYDTTNIEYSVYDPKTGSPTVTIAVDGNIVSTSTLASSTGVYPYKEVVSGAHTITITCGETVKTLNANIEELDIDASQVTAGLAFDFNPVGKSNNDANRVWTNGTNSMEVSPNFDWVNGGYKIDENGDAYFLVKAGTNITFDYFMFDGGIDRNPSILGSEMKIVFMTENVQDTNAVWFSNVENTVSEVNGVSKTTSMGIQMGVHEGWLKTNNASDTDVIGEDSSSSIAASNTYLYLPYSEEDIIEMDINIDTLNRDDQTANAFVMAYEDGVPSKAYVYDNSDRFYQYTPQPIVIGSDYCDVRIYRMKIYSTSLTTENIMRNFIADARSSTVMLERYDRNSIYYNRESGTYTPYSGQGVIDPERLATVIPNVKVLMLETDHFTTSKKTFVKSSLRCIHASGGDMFEGDPILDNWMFENGWHSGQGTTSDNYGDSSRNVDFLFNCDGVHKPSDKVDAESDYISKVTIGYGTESESTETVTDWKGNSGKVSLTRTSIPNNFFNLKVNVASSENANNMLLQKRFNDFLPYISPAKKRDSRIKNDMEFVPAILFLRETNPDISTHNEFLDTEWHFYSLGNIGDSKKSDYTRAYYPDDMNEFTIEISDNTKNNATFQSGVYLDDDGVRQIEKFTIVESEEDGETILTPVSIAKPQSYVYPITLEEWEHEDNMRSWCINNEGFDGDHSFEARYACCGDYRDGKLVNDTSGRGKEQIKLNEGVWRAFYRWVVTSTDEEFVNELDQWCVRSSVEFFYAFTHIYTMMDSRAKNTFWHFAKTDEYRQVIKPVEELLHVYCEFDGENYITTTDTSIDTSKTYYTQYAFDMWDYDNDTALGINNNGELVFPYGREDDDYNIDGDSSSGYVFNGATSAFWCRLRDLLQNEITSTFQNVASECFNADNLIKQFDQYQECYPEEIWRLDAQRKYIRVFTGESVDNSKPKKATNYLRDMMQGRKKYQRRQWVKDQMMYFGTKHRFGEAVNDANRITFRCYNPGADAVVEPDYTLKITPFSDMYVTAMFGNGNTQSEHAKAGETVELTFNVSDATDTQVTVYGASRLQAFDDLSACYIASANFSHATKLKKLIIGSAIEGYSNTRLTTFSFDTGDELILEELDVRGCVNLGGSLNLSNCQNLRTLYAEGTKLTGVTFATNGNLQIAHLPDTINTLIMRHLNNLVDFDASLIQLEDLTLQGGTLDSFDMVSNCIDTLRVLRLYDINWSNANVEILDEIHGLFYSLLTGTVHVPSIGQYGIYKYQTAWPDLTIVPSTIIQQFVVTFVNYDGTVLDTQYVQIFENAIDPIIREENPISTPIRESTEQYDYTYNGWDKPLTNITSDRTITATYSETIRRYTIQYVSRGTPVLTREGDYGENIVYDGNIPTYTLEEPYKFYLFDRWEKSGFLDNGFDSNGVKIVNAVFDEFEYSEDAFNGKELSELRPVEIYAMNKLGLANNILEVNDTCSITLGHDFNYNDINSVEIIGKNSVFGDEYKSVVEFNGSNYFDTGISLFDEDRDFILAIDYEYTGSAANSVLAQCYLLNGSVGFKLQYNNGVQVKWGSDSYNVAKVNEREMLVIRHKKGDTNLTIYNSNLNEMEIDISSLSSKECITTTTLMFGCERQTSTILANYATGKIHWAKIWYKDLGEDVCKNLALWTHEKIGFKVSGFNRYFLADNPDGMSSFGLIATNLLERTRKMNNNANTNVGGWAASDLNALLNTRLYNSLPLQIKSIIKPVVVWSNIGGGSTAIPATQLSSSNCYITLPSLKDVDGINSSGDANDEPYNSESLSSIASFSSIDARKIAFENGDYGDYFLRSPSNKYTSYWWRVQANGSLTYISQANITSGYGVLIEISF